MQYKESSMKVLMALFIKGRTRRQESLVSQV